MLTFETKFGRRKKKNTVNVRSGPTAIMEIYQKVIMHPIPTYTPFIL